MFAVRESQVDSEMQMQLCGSVLLEVFVMDWVVTTTAPELKCSKGEEFIQ